MADRLENRCALVTGGSGGIGADLARQLASHGADVVLVARREERLRENADTLERDFGVAADYVVMDLARREAPEELTAVVDERGLQIDILVNNAGFGAYGEFLDNDWSRQADLLDLDVVTPVHLSHIFGRRMVERGWGRLLQVASFGAFQPTPTYATYCAAKAFLVSWGEAWSFELKDTGVSNTVVSPGVTESEFFEHAGQERTLYQKASMMDSETVAAIAVDAMLAGRTHIIPGFLNAATMFLNRFVPSSLRRWIAFKTMEN